MDQIRDAILSGDRTEETYANLSIPQTYRAVTVHKDEVDMFEGLASRDKDPRKSLHVDDVPVPDVLRFERELLEQLRRTDILTTIRETATFDEDTANAVTRVIAEVKAGFRTSDAHLPDEEKHAKALEDGNVSHETITVRKG